MLLNFAVSAKLFIDVFLNFLSHLHFFFLITVVCRTVHLLLLWHFVKLEDWIHSGIIASNGNDSKFQKCRIGQPGQGITEYSIESTDSSNLSLA